jgi:thiol-disulfide isomerase/thioredoxin
MKVKVKSNLPILGAAPSTFVGLGPWHNSTPLDLQSLRGKVVLIDFWTYSCINCIRTFPHLEALWQKYKDQPFVLIGIHSPEFTFEKSEKNVAAAIKEHGLTYPTAQDNDFRTWKAFDNQYWPAHYLIDAEGNIRYTHFGEGAYEETDQAVASLLEEIGANPSLVKTMPESEKVRRDITREIYLFSRSWDAFGNAQGRPDTEVHAYTEPASMTLDKYYLQGSWQIVDDERHVLRSNNGEIRLRALAGEVNLVLGLEDGAKPVMADIEVDGKATQSITINSHDLYNLFNGEYGEHNIVLKIHEKGVAAYAFTFGS